MPNKENSFNLRKTRSSFRLQNGTLITTLLQSNLDFDLVHTENHRIVEYTAEKCFNSFVRSAVDARREAGKNPYSSFVAETTKLLAQRSYGEQVMHRSRHTRRKTSATKRLAASGSKLFSKLNHVNNVLYEVELAKEQTEHKEQIVVGLFIMQYANLRMLELSNIFFTKGCAVNRLEELEMNTDPLHFAPAATELEESTRPEKKAEWERQR